MSSEGEKFDSNKDGIDNVRLSHDAQSLIIQSQGYPNHPTAKFPNSGNPNTIQVQDFHFRLPLEPRVAQKITRVPMGPIGMALNGVVFFNPFEAGGMNAVRLPGFFHNLGHANVINTCGGGSFGHLDGPVAGATSLRQAFAAWKAGADVVDYAAEHRELARAFESFPADADRFYPGWRQRLGR